MPALLSVQSVSVSLPQEGRAPAPVLTGINFSLERGQMTALVGESGSGKSTLGLSLLRLLPRGSHLTGAAILEEPGGPANLFTLSARELRKRRGQSLAMIFQDPGASLDPRLRAGDQVAGCLRIHRRISRREAWCEAVHMLDRVGLPDPEQRARDYPHQLSGGMRQRVAIAMALVNRPAVLIADEPTTALDLRLQQQILQLLRQEADVSGLAVLLITHDLRLAGQWCDRIAVLYAGRLVESGPRDAVLRHPRHPYTRALLAVSPSLDQPAGRPVALPGAAASAPQFLHACAFAPRCSWRAEDCTGSVPEWSEDAAGHGARCFRAAEVAASSSAFAAGGRP